ncbi:MAG: SHOCT domain-containing protein [Actinomycetales bacterium]|nr:SHOCT domain-containing protein [Actinomycetales bacterium]
MGLIGMAARTAVIAGTATAVSGRVAHAQGERYAQQAQAQQAQAQQAQQAAPVQSAQDEQTAQLQNLAALHAQGVLTDEEFSAAKAKVLGI